MPARGGKGRFEVVIGALGTLDADGKAVYHRLGDFVDLVESEAERLLGLGAVKDTQAAGYQPAAESAAPPAAQGSLSDPGTLQDPLDAARGSDAEAGS